MLKNIINQKGQVVKYLRYLFIGTLISLLSACGNQPVKPQETIVVKAAPSPDHKKTLEEAMVEVDMTQFGFRGY